MGIFKPTYGSRLNLDHPLARGLVGCWVMNEGSGTIIYNSVRKNKGIFSGTSVWIPEGGIDLVRGSSDWIQVASPLNLDFGTGNYTIITKINMASLASYDGILGFDTYNPAWFINNTHMGMYSGGFLTESTATLAIDTDYTLSWVRVGIGADQLQYYVDGETGGTAIHSASTSNPSAMGIGSIRGDIADETFNGIFYYIYIYDRALTPSEIQALHINPYAMFEDPYPIELFAPVAAEVGWTGIMDGITNPGKIDGISVANIKSINEIQ
jgi:hypothetical protein